MFDFLGGVTSMLVSDICTTAMNYLYSDWYTTIRIPFIMKGQNIIILPLFSQEFGSPKTIGEKMLSEISACISTIIAFSG